MSKANPSPLSELAPLPRAISISLQPEIAVLVRQLTAENRRPLTWTVEELLLDGLLAQKRVSKADAERLRAQRGGSR